MKLLTVLLTFMLGISTHARSLTFSCQTRNWDIVFSTNVDDNAVEVRRAYEYSPTLIIYLRIPLGPGSVQAAVQVSDHGKIYNEIAECEMVEK